MSSMKYVMRHPGRAVEDAAEEIMERTRGMRRRPYTTGGVVMLVLGVLTFIWLFPELRRYMRMERM